MGAYQTPPAHYNLIEVLLDDVGLEVLSMYNDVNRWLPGFAYPNTPVFDSIAASGVRFNNFWAHPMCSPDRAAALTGNLNLISSEHPDGTGMGWVIHPPSTVGLFTSAMGPLAKHHDLEGTGFRVEHIGKWHLGAGQDGPTDPVTDGHSDLYFGCLSNADKHQSSDPAASYIGTYTDWTMTELPGDGTYTQTPHTTSHQLIREVSDVQARIQAAAAAGERLFLRWWTHFPHSPFNVVPDSLLDVAATMRGAAQEPAATGPVHNNRNVVFRRVKAMIEAADKALGDALSVMTAAQKAETIIILRADNATDSNVITPLGTPLEPPTGVYDPLHAKFTLYEQGIRSPMVIGAHPDNLTPSWIDPTMRGSSTGAICQTHDVWATMAEATLSNWRSKSNFSRTLSPLLRNEAAQIRDYAMIFAFEPNGASWLASTTAKVAIRDQAGNKLIRRRGIDQERYDLVSDPVELTPLSLSGSVYDELSAKLDSLGATQ